jgi:toxin ParE1/3/4
MPFSVFLTDDAALDLDELYGYIDLHDVPGKANHVLGKIEKAITSLSENPERGVYPKDLMALGIREYREIFFKPYRIIYRVMGKNVYVLLIVDGRRDMQSLLLRRLLEGPIGI